MADCDTGSVAEWLIAGAPSAPEPQQVLAELCERLVVCGISLWRVAVFVRTLHPAVMGRRFLWHRLNGVSVSEAPFELLDGYMRQRLRAALTGRVGPGWWNQRIPNALLRELGLISLGDWHRQYQTGQLAAPVRKD